MTYDYSEHEKPKSEDALAKLSELADKQLALEKELAEAEKAVEDAEKALREVSEIEIPELMDQLSIEDFKTTSGLKVSVKEDIRAHIKKANQPDAFQWLREHGHEALIKRELKVQFGKGEDEQAESTLKTLREAELQAEDKAYVHPSTLAKFVREKLKAGEEIPLELFGVHRQRVSKVNV